MTSLLYCTISTPRSPPQHSTLTQYVPVTYPFCFSRSPLFLLVPISCSRYCSQRRIHCFYLLLPIVSFSNHRPRLERLFLPALPAPSSFPGSLLFTPQEAREGRPWLGLVTCLPKYGRLQISDCREGRLSVNLPILSVLGMGKHAPVRINVQNRACFKGHVEWSSRNP